MTKRYDAVIIGAGVIGLEYATIFSALDIQVTLIEPRTTMLDFVDREIKVPVGTEHEWEMPYALVGVAKDFDEMGTWAAKTALRILGGARPDQIPVTANKKGKLYFNRRIARRLGIDETPALATFVD